MKNIDSFDMLKSIYEVESRKSGGIEYLHHKCIYSISENLHN